MCIQMLAEAWLAALHDSAFPPHKILGGACMSAGFYHNIRLLGADSGAVYQRQCLVSLCNQFPLGCMGSMQTQPPLKLLQEGHTPIS